MNKKLYLVLVLTLILIPLVSAQLMDSVENTLSIIFDATGDLVYIKACIWVILFFVVFKAVERMFPENRWVTVILAIVISSLGVRYMPEEYLDYIGGGYAVILGLIIFLLPYFGGSIIGDLLRFGKKGKTFLIIALYAAFAYGLLRWEGFPIEQEAFGLLYDVLNWMQENSVITLIIIGLICVYFLRKTMGRRGPAADVPQTIERGPGFWSGLGRGAGNAGQLAKQGLTRGSNWLAKRRAIAKQRAMLKAGWKQKQAKLAGQITKMPKGKYIKKGTPGYDLLRKRQIQIAKARKKQGKKPGFKT